MVESSERSHRSGSRRRRRRRVIEFFLCFSSRSSSSSSSSMKISSKSILSPGRSREPSLSLSSSLSRRLRSNGSMKGGQSSPMFPTGSKKKGSSFEPPEPSSPKVTCIGQVRVKSKKKHGRKLRNRSQRRGEVSFRKTEQNQDGNGINGSHHQQQPSQECLPHRNQRWVHLPLSICETLRAFGAEFNCFQPCGGRSSSCSWTSERDKVEKRRGSNGGAGSSSSCGAVFARWLFALQENEEKGREIEPVVRGEEERRVEREVVREIEIEISEEKLETNGEIEEEDEIEEGRESICIPPKNALLLMRSRSAPFRMSSLANRFWESPGPEDNMEKLELEEDEEDDELEVNRTMIEESHKDIEEEGATSREMEVKQEEETKVEEMVDKWGSIETLEEDTNQLKEEEIAESQIKVVKEEEDALKNAELRQEDELVQKHNEAVKGKGSSPDEVKLQIEEREEEFNLLDVEEEEEVKEVVEKRRVSFSTSSTMYFEPESTETESEEEESAPEAVVPLEETVVVKSTEEEVSEEEEEEETEISTSRSSTEQHSKCQEGEESKERETETASLLPECLLLMMCEPKLSMEVSKETWVCSTDFVRFHHSEKKALQKNGGDESTKKKKLSKVANPVATQQPRQQQQKQTQFQPARSSYSKVEPVVAKSMTMVVEKNRVNSGGVYEPFVLKRCKSEPMRNSAKLAPEVCFWKKNKLEPHPPPGVGATGIGF